MKKMTTVLLSLSALFLMSTVSAGGDVTAMIGKWKWEGFTIEVTKCATTEICAKVISGPKNVGLQMIKSKLTSQGDGFVGKIAHPQTGDTYNAKLNMANADTWHMDGCTSNNVCASGDFTRIK